MKKFIGISLVIMFIALYACSSGDSGGSIPSSGSGSSYPTCGTSLTGGVQSNLVGTWHSAANNPSYDFQDEYFTLNSDGTCTGNWIWNGSVGANAGPCGITDVFNVVLWSTSGNEITFRHGAYILDSNDQLQFWNVSTDTYWWEIKSSDTNTMSIGRTSYYVNDGSGTLKCPENGISSRVISNNQTLVSIIVTPINAATSAGPHDGVQFAATGVYSDNSTQNLTSQVAWTSSDSTKASITASGFATSKLPRDASAYAATITATFGGISGSTGLTVYPEAFSNIAITPASASVQAGKTVQFTATGTYSDGTTKDVTATVTWTSSNTGVATCSGVTNGLVNGISAGTTTIAATANDILNHSTSVPLTVY